jgi:hypothetical protein
MLPVVSMQAPLHSFWPAVGHEQVPPVQVVPPEQVVPQVPQLPLSVSVFAQAPPEQAVSPVAQPVDEQALLLQTWVPVQVIPQVPQLLAFDGTQLPPQLSSPEPQVHEPPWQVWPDPQTVPQVPQF